MKKLIYISILFQCWSCKDEYALPLDLPVRGYLVVDGTINSGQGKTEITISRTTTLYSPFNIDYIRNATVTLEGKDNSRNAFDNAGDGKYTHPQLNLNRSQQYRLKIQVDGKEYASAFLPVNQTPAIDSVNWQYSSTGVDIYMDAKGNANTSGYYRWDFSEAWEFHSAFVPNIKYNDVPMAVFLYPTRQPDNSRAICYKTFESTTIEILSTSKISKDTTHYKLISIPRGDWKLSVLYSMKARQYAISKEGFEYLSKMKKNTEQTGSIFDAQPSELKGNLTCLSAPAEPVIGFMEISEMHEKRIWIRNSQLPAWNYSHGCGLTELKNVPDSIKKYGNPTPIVDSESDNTTVFKFMYSQIGCIDCTLRGTLTKPDFWP